jgi:cytochrome bd-type quinol oxidase subunit 2
MIILLFITVPISLILQIFGIISFMTIVDDIFIIILGVWILYYTKKGENSRNNKIGSYTVVSLYIGIIFRSIGLTPNKHDTKDTSEFFILSSLLLAYSFYLRIAVAIVSFKCKCCKCCT